MSNQSNASKFVIKIAGKYVKGICVAIPNGKPMILLDDNADLAIHFHSELDAGMFIRSLPYAPCGAEIVEV